MRACPRDLEPELAAIPGVAQVETRVVVDVTLDMPALDEPISGRLISLPEHGPLLDVVRLREGRLPDRPDEVLLNEPFARAHDLHPGDSVHAIVDGRLRAYRIAGLALSAEYVFAISNTGIADDSRFGLMWAGREPLASAYDMLGSFNDLTIRVGPGGSSNQIMARVDAMLAPYGGIGAIDRRDQPSAHLLRGELEQLEVYAVILPAIFIAVAAFLLHVVLTRLIGTQRDQIATLKAFGYTDIEVGLHYLSMIAVIVALGTAMGTGLGVFFGRGLTARYAQFFRFPDLRFRLEPDVVAIGAIVTLVTASLGAISAVRAVVRLAPAEAMRPESPARYRRSWIERLGLSFLLSGAARMIVRSLGRRPVRAILAATGIGLATSIVAVCFFMFGSFARLTDFQFRVVSREDSTVTFRRKIDPSALTELLHVPGVFAAEPFRVVPIEISVAHRKKKLPLTGVPERALFRRIVSTDEQVAEPPRDGVVLTSWLAEQLGVGVGDFVRIESLEGAHVVREVKVSGLVSEMVGMNAYMRLDALHRMLGEEEKLTGARLLIDRRAEASIESAMKRLPEVASVISHARLVRLFEEQSGAWMIVMTSILSGFAAVIAFGVIYNTARIALAERERELASLRVLGFTVGEITTIFVGELAVLVAVGILLGCFAFTKPFAFLIVGSGNLEAFRFPLVVEPKALAAAAIVTAVSAIASALVVRRRLDHLDLVAVLKSKD
jgi:putative ABC transport system permease protein